MLYNEIIRNRREDLDFKQYEFAEEIGILPKTYSTYENGLRSIPYVTLNKILLSLDISLDYIFSFTNTRRYKDPNNIDLDVLTTRLRSVRKKAGYSQEKIARLIGCNQQTLSEYERGNLVIPIETLKLYCEKTNVSADYLTGRTDVIKVEEDA